MAGIESPLPPFYAPPKLSVENVVKLKFIVWAIWNAFCVCILPVKATLYIISTAWNKFAGTPIASRDVQPKKADPKVNPNHVNIKTLAANTHQAASRDHSSVTLAQKMSSRPDGLSQQSSQAVTYQIPAQIPKQNQPQPQYVQQRDKQQAGQPVTPQSSVQVSNLHQHQYTEQRHEQQAGQNTFAPQQIVSETNQRNHSADVSPLHRSSGRQVLRDVRRISREEYLAEQDRTQTENDLLQQVCDNSAREIQSQQFAQIEQGQINQELFQHTCDVSYWEHHNQQLAQHEGCELSQACEQSLQNYQYQQQAHFEQQTQQAIWASLIRKEPAVVSPVCDSVQTDCPPPLVTILEHIAKEERPHFEIVHIIYWLRDKQNMLAGLGYDLSQVPDDEIGQFLAECKISRIEFHQIYNLSDIQPLQLRLVQEFFAYKEQLEQAQKAQIEQEREAQEQEKMALEQEVSLAQEAVEAAKNVARARLKDEPPENQDGVFSISFKSNHESIIRRFWPDDTVQSLFDFIQNSDYPFTDFKLKIGHPSEGLEPSSLNLGQLQMGKKFIVRVEADQKTLNTVS